VGRARHELGRFDVPRRRRGLRRRRRVERGRTGPPARRAGVPVDRARPRPSDDGAAAVPAPDGVRRARLAVLTIAAMKVRRVVTGHDANGKAVFASDTEVDGYRPTLMSASEFHLLWGGDGTPHS